MKSSSAVSSSQPNVVQRVESVSEAEPTQASDAEPAHADSVSESEPVSEEEPVQAVATVKPVRTKLHASCLCDVLPFQVTLLGWVIANVGGVGCITPIMQRGESSRASTTTRVEWGIFCAGKSIQIPRRAR
jgi:hypothetical protein